MVVASTKDGLDEFHKAVVAKDEYGINEMILGGSMLPVPSGTRVRVIDITMLTSQVRVLEGKYMGEAGWVDSSFVKGSPTAP